MLLHLSDLHFGTERPECLSAIQKFCAKHRPEAIVISGDLTQRARLKQFIACRKFLDSLHIPYIAVPGNHDIALYHLWDRFFKSFGLYRKCIGEPESVLETKHFYLIGVNSIYPRVHKKGIISTAQIDRVQQKLIGAPKNKLKIVVSHQPFYVAANSRHTRDCPRLGRAALLAWGKHDLYALLHGHLHQVAVYDLNKEYQLNLHHSIYEVHAGTATSHRLYKSTPNSFNVIYGEGIFEHYFFNEITQEFILKV